MPQPTASDFLEERVSGLEERHTDLRADFDSLTKKYEGLSVTVEELKERGWHTLIKDEEIAASHSQALKLKQELAELGGAVQVPDVAETDGKNITDTTGAQNCKSTAGTNQPKANGIAKGAAVKVVGSVPPHLRGKDKTGNGTQSPQPNGESVAEKDASPLHNPLMTEGPVDTIVQRPQSAPNPEVSDKATGQLGAAVSELSQDMWKPQFIRSLKPFNSDAIPAATEMISFHPDFLSRTLRGTNWSPGFHFITPKDRACVLPNRTYYLLDPATEPYLPSTPGAHGAKLTAFFNRNPEEVYGYLRDGHNPYMHVPLFILQNGRYIYFGNYSQTRWSDKLGHDTMKAHVPQHVKEHWAKELTSPVREDWVTEELKKHFFERPPYDGRVFAKAEDGETATTEEENKYQRRMEKDVKLYVAELREWERDANLKTALMTQKIILDAFDAADADDPPALRLWWEYLECVDWRRDFYDLLVTLQSRETMWYQARAWML